MQPTLQGVKKTPHEMSELSEEEEQIYFNEWYLIQNAYFFGFPKMSCSDSSITHTVGNIRTKNVFKVNLNVSFESF